MVKKTMKLMGNPECRKCKSQNTIQIGENKVKCNACGYEQSYTFV